MEHSTNAVPTLRSRPFQREPSRSENVWGLNKDEGAQVCPCRSTQALNVATKSLAEHSDTWTYIKHRSGFTREQTLTDNRHLLVDPKKHSVCSR